MLLWFQSCVDSYRRDEDGLALTEYLVLLGVLTAAVLSATTLFGTNLANTWVTWASWVDTVYAPE